MGDFNTPFIHDRIQIGQLFMQYQYFPFINEATHFNCGTLDLCFSNKENIIIDLHALWVTDHFMYSIPIL